MSTPSPTVPADESNSRPALVRAESRVMAGVCGGLAAHVGTSVRTMRVLMVLLAIAGGAGLLLYAWLWVLVPSATDARRSAEVLDAGRRRGLADAMRDLPRPEGPAGASVRYVLAGAGLLIAGLLLFAQVSGLDFAWQLIWPAIFISAGAVVVWTQIDTQRSLAEARTARPASSGARWPAALRLGVGLLLVITGLILLVAQSLTVEALWAGALVAVVVLAGLVVVLLPWGLRFWRDYTTERTSRVRAAERADIAAHLHDSVLQTLALIQKRAGDEEHVIRLARAQERELRQWLYEDDDVAASDVGEAIKAEAAALEAEYAATFDVVTVGQLDAGAGRDALVAAAREAMLNAAKHAGGRVSVFVEGRAPERGPATIDVFVRDRGGGFDLSQVAEDRLGVRESIVGRMRRHGGTATIRSSTDGTEVALRLELRGHDGAPSGGGQQQQTADKDHV
ncbi:ATP-binding protein [Zhihengliuella flava]|uniref:Signal transduction histidine kinase/phage shock protein PspC (Stress-responsive transcriptional regulator) n=1 Tax=Zhihengliuella flava TaxID=1285193 RepID=A0A931DBE3_9MICC|nr:ATP-binding protein [Zhihengliuella flava]MBG6085362.1 signal transduction histidine kinase/phage shock protein PspC (stress-responsive transcriptional regulator) [Zhihengliuella flava]